MATNYIFIQITTDSPLIDLKNHTNQATKPSDSVNSCIDQLAKLVSGSKSGTIQIATSSSSSSPTVTGTNSANNTFLF